jgi:predicted nucleic acid-binding protein
MNELRDAFADTSYWIALVIKQDQHHRRAQAWSLRLTGRIVTTTPVLIETANALSRPGWRTTAVALIDRLFSRSDVDVVRLDDVLWQRAWTLYRDRPDKGWSLTDCVSFEVMHERGLNEALTADEHFRQSGFRAVLLDDPDSRSEMVP